MQKSPDAFRTISEVAEELDLPQHVLRFWETRFSTIRPLKRGGGRRYYRPDDIDLLKGIRHLLYGQGYTIKGVQRILREQGLRSVQALGRGEQPAMPVTHEPSDDEEDQGQEIDAAIDATVGLAADPDSEDADGRSDAGSLRQDEVTYRLPGAIRPEIDLNRTGSGAGLAGDDIVHLRGVLDELLECERILRSLQAE